MSSDQPEPTDGSTAIDTAEAAVDEVVTAEVTPASTPESGTSRRATLLAAVTHHRWVVAAAAVFVIARTVIIAASGSPARVPDSALFIDGAISLSGNAAQFWPVPALFRLGGSDSGRMWLQHLLATIAWCTLASGVAHVVRKEWLRITAVVAILVMGLAPQVVNWDTAMLGESIVASFAVLATALWLWRDLASPTVGVLTGAAALLMVCARPTTLPLAAILVVSGAVAAVRSGALRGRIAGGALFLLAGGGIVWMVSTLDAHDEAYRSRDDHGISFGGELAAGQLWDRMLADDDTFVWLTDRGMPDPVDGIRPAPNNVAAAERAATWPVFLEAASSDADWSTWLDEQGSSLAVDWALEQPVAALSGWADHSGEVLTGTAGVETGAGAVRGVVAEVQPFFRGSGWTSDVALLFAVAAVLVLFARRARDNGEVHRADAGAAVAAAGFVTAAAGWLLTGVEFERHAVPGPLLLRLGLVLMTVTLVDSMAPRYREPFRTRR